MLSLCADAVASAVFRCTDPTSNVTVFSDRPCQQTPSTKLTISPANQIRGLSQYERSLINKLNTKKDIKPRNKTKSKPAKRTKPGLEKLCIRNQLRIDKISLRLKQGYKSKKYNEYHDKLRLYKKFRSQHCV